MPSFRCASWATVAVAFLSAVARAQPLSETLLADLEAGLRSEREAVAERAAERVERLAKSVEAPERLLPLVERAVLSRFGTEEYGVVGCGQTAFARVAERAERGAPVLASLERLLARLRPSLLREWIASELNELARRFPTESLESIGRLLGDRQGSVREHAISSLFEAAGRAAPARFLPWADAQLAAEGLRPAVRTELVLGAKRSLGLAAKVPAERSGEYRALLDRLVESARSEVVRELAREARAALEMRELERSERRDRFAAYRRADGRLDWGRLFRAPFASERGSAAEDFAPRRSGPAGEVVKGFLPDVVATEVFKTVRGAAAEWARAEAAAGAPGAAERASALETLEVRYLETNDIVARRRGRTVEVSYGLLHEVYARSMKLMESGAVSAGERGMYQARVLGLVFAHEIAHVLGLRAERPADARAVRLVWSSLLAPANAAQAEVALRGTIDLFDRPSGARAFDTLLYRLRSFFRYGLPGGRLEAMRRAARDEPDPLARYRRADGTVVWASVAKDRALVEGAGLAKFGLALFLKELAHVAASGDRARAEEFFDYLQTTDFYAHYGLFVAGARLGEVAYARYLSQYVRPRFVSGILQRNLALATGMALPLIVDGRFEGRAFAISFASLGLSSALVSFGVQSLAWATGLRRAQSAGLLARFGPAAGRLARLGGWFYTVGELAVVLYFADRIEEEWRERLDERRERRALGEAAERLVAELSSPEATVAQVRAALREHRDAWIGYRDRLYAPLEAEEVRLARRLEGLARAAKLSEDERRALGARTRRLPHLRSELEERHGSVGEYLEGRDAEERARLQRDVDRLMSDYDARRAELFRGVYEEGRREGDFLAGTDPAELFAPPEDGAGGIFARWRRERAGAALGRLVAERAAKNRLQAYEDEEALLAALARFLQDAGRGERAALIGEELERVRRLHAADARLARGEAVVESRGGLEERLRELDGDEGRR
ncbi:MAG: hypothetical protein D6731_18095 [Planctomycetota bacterium]|nr:MAG: hypothetical protein D6731_18095 [Planctomycetota bacterium]